MDDPPARGAAGTFLRRFAKDPTAVGAIAPSSRFLAARMVADLDFPAGVKVAELGAGTGPFTRALLARLPADGRLFAVERDPAFCAVLREQLPDLDLAEDSAERLLSLAEAREMAPLDHVVSGLPFASLPREVTEATLDQVAAALRPGGTFTTFQYLFAYPLPKAVRFRAQMQARLGPLRTRHPVFRNLPPALVLRWRKP